MKSNLKRLANEANQAHLEVQVAREKSRLLWAESVQHALRAGEALNEAKAQLEHGEWTPWLDEHFNASHRTANLYMRLSRKRDQVEAYSQRVANMDEDAEPVSLRQLDGMLREPRSEQPPSRSLENGDTEKSEAPHGYRKIAIRVKEPDPKFKKVVIQVEKSDPKPVRLYARVEKSHAWKERPKPKQLIIVETFEPDNVARRLEIVFGREGLPDIVEAINSLLAKNP